MLKSSLIQVDDELLRGEPQILNGAVDQEDEKPHKARKAVRSGKEPSVLGTMARNAQMLNYSSARLWVELGLAHLGLTGLSLCWCSPLRPLYSSSG